MLKYKEILLKEEDINEKGIELLITIEDTSSKRKDEELEEPIEEILIKNFEDFYIENPCEKYYEVRSDNLFSFDKQGVENLKSIYNLLEKHLKNVNISIAIFTNDFLFEVEGKRYNQEEVSLVEFEKNIEIFT